MRVEFEFDPNKVAAHGYRMKQILVALKRIFEEDGFCYTSEDDVIVFEGNNHEDGCANMWLNLMDLINSGWFLECASRC